MFKKVFSRLFGAKKASPPRVAPSSHAPQPVATPVATAPGATAPPGISSAPPAPKPAAAAPAPAASPASQDKKPAALQQWEKDASRALDPKAGPEQICGITPGMSREEIQERLAMLYRRHNRAASSLDEKLREEAEVMLEAISALREKHFGRTGKA